VNKAAIYELPVVFLCNMLSKPGEVEIVLHLKIEPVLAYIVYEEVSDVFLRLGFGYEGELIKVLSQECDIGSFLNIDELNHSGELAPIHSFDIKRLQHRIRLIYSFFGDDFLNASQPVISFGIVKGTRV